MFKRSKISKLYFIALVFLAAVSFDLVSHVDFDDRHAEAEAGCHFCESKTTGAVNVPIVSARAYGLVTVITTVQDNPVSRHYKNFHSRAPPLV